MLITKDLPTVVNHPEDKIQTILFLPKGEGRKGEGGLRTRGYFKHSYKLADGKWWICDTDGNPVKEAPEDIQEKIKNYVSTLNTEIQITALPLITVITVVLNGEKYLEETIQSVINQTYPNVEYIIVDGGSTDGTLDIIKKYEDKIDYWVSEKDNGIYDAMNKGLRVALGKWIGFLGSDDYYEATALEELIKSFYIDDEVEVLYGNSKVLLGNQLLYIRNPTSNIKEIEKSFIFFHPDSIAKINLYKKLGYYDNSYKIAGDYDFFLRAYFNGAKFKKVETIALNFRISGTSSDYKQAFKEKLIIYKKFNLRLTFLIIACFEYMVKSIKRVPFLKDTSYIMKCYRTHIKPKIKFLPR